MGQVELLNPHWEALTPETQQAFRKIAGLEFVNCFYAQVRDVFTLQMLLGHSSLEWSSGMLAWRKLTPSGSIGKPVLQTIGGCRLGQLQ